MLLNKRYRQFLFLSLIVVVVILLPTADLWAQCPMCRIGAETNLASGGTAGKGLNKGILLLLGLPYVLMGTLGFIWWNNKKKPTED